LPSSPLESIFSFDLTPPESTSDSDSGLVRLARKLSISSPDKPAFSPSLQDLLVYTQGVKYQGFSKLVDYEPRHQFSVSERTGGRLLKDHKADWIKHNFSHISRVYPKAVRVSSSNFDPVPFWAAGCQCVAMNWQTPDAGAVLNHAMFVDTPGYVLKPLALRQKTTEPTMRYRIRIKVISAQRLPLSCELYVEATINSTTRKTTNIEGRVMNAIWNETFEFTVDTTPSMLDLTFLHLEIRQSNKSLLAQWVRSISMSPKGYHYLPLYDGLFSRYVFATLFVRIDVDTLHVISSE